MNTNTIIEIVKIVIIVILGYLSIYFKANAKLKENVAHAIDNAESEYKDVTNAGGEKFEYAVNWLYSLVPTIVKPFITKETIGILVQKAFDVIEDYAKKQLDKITNSGE